MNDKTLWKIKGLGFCCPFAFFFAMQEEKEVYLASLLSVTPRTVRYWRRRFREQTLSCPKNRQCLWPKNSPQSPEQVVGSFYEPESSSCLTPSSAASSPSTDEGL